MLQTSFRSGACTATVLLLPCWLCAGDDACSTGVDTGLGKVDEKLDGVVIIDASGVILMANKVCRTQATEERGCNPRTCSRSWPAWEPRQLRQPGGRTQASAVRIGSCASHDQHALHEQAAG